MADLIYKTYHTMYIIGPGDSAVIEANPDAVGLKLGIVYQTEIERNELFFHRFTCSNDSVLTITILDGQNITYFGDHATLNAKGKLRELSAEPYNMAAATLDREEVDPIKNGSKIKEAIIKVKDSVLDSSELIIKNITGKEVHLSDTSQHKTENETPTKVSQLSKPAGTGKGSNGLQNVNTASTSSGDKLVASPMGKATLHNTVQNYQSHDDDDEEDTKNQTVDPAEAARKWEEELERVKREKKWEAELARIKQAKATPQVQRVDVESVSSVTASPPAGVSKVAVPSPPSAPLSTTSRRTAPVADTHCTMCILS